MKRSGFTMKKVGNNIYQDFIQGFIKILDNSGSFGAI